MTAQQPAARHDVAVEDGDAVGPDHHLAAIAQAHRTGIQRRTRRHPAHLCVVARPLALPVTAHQHAAAANIARGIQPGGAVQPNPLAQHLDLAAGLTHLATSGIQRSGHPGHAITATVDHDAPATVANTARLHHPFQVEHGVGKAGAGGCAQLGRAAVGAQRAQLLQPRDQAAVVAGVEEDQAIAFHVHLHLGGRCQADAAGVDLPGLHQAGRHQHHAAVGRTDAPFGAQRAGFTVGHIIAAEQQPARGQILTADAQRAGQQPAHIDLAITAENDAPRVDQPHRPVGLQPAQNLRRVTTDHPVDQHRVAARLGDHHALLRADGKARPVQAGPCTGLADVELLRTTLGDGGLAEHRLRTFGQAEGQRRQPRQRHGQTHRAQDRAVVAVPAQRVAQHRAGQMGGRSRRQDRHGDGFQGATGGTEPGQLKNVLASR